MNNTDANSPTQEHRKLDRIGLMVNKRICGVKLGSQNGYKWTPCLLKKDSDYDHLGDVKPTVSPPKSE